ncbi:hypothetical protein [Paenibacillus oralis]|uniref:hypothetical protein n=1 Tax=Paenibacillus oralis TaxID=2490856 RepID=UPI0015A91260|nr:hypothetical protein [Paenibacillus oralis]
MLWQAMKGRDPIIPGAATFSQVKSTDWLAKRTRIINQKDRNHSVPAHTIRHAVPLPLTA